MTYLGAVASRASGATTSLTLTPATRSRSPLAEYDQRLNSFDVPIDFPAAPTVPEPQGPRLESQAFESAHPRPVPTFPALSTDSLIGTRGADGGVALRDDYAEPTNTGNHASSIARTDNSLAFEHHSAPATLKPAPSPQLPRFADTPTPAHDAQLPAQEYRATYSDLKVVQSTGSDATDSEPHASPNAPSLTREHSDPLATKSSALTLSHALAAIDNWMNAPAPVVCTAPRRSTAPGPSVQAQPNLPRLEQRLAGMHDLTQEARRVPTLPRLSIGQIEIEIVQDCHRHNQQRADTKQRSGISRTAVAPASTSPRPSALDAKLSFGMRQR